ncbi:MAG: hypothetical protein WC933_01805 [Candidatus Paceibacterota bacterium]
MMDEMAIGAYKGPAVQEKGTDIVSFLKAVVSDLFKKEEAPVKTARKIVIHGAVVKGNIAAYEKISEEEKAIPEGSFTRLENNSPEATTWKMYTEMKAEKMVA